MRIDREKWREIVGHLDLMNPCRAADDLFGNGRAAGHPRKAEPKVTSLSLSKRLYRVGALIAFVLLLSAAMTWRMGSIATTALAAEEESTLSTMALAEAQSAVWALRWGVANYLATSDTAAKAKMVADSPKLRGDFDTALQKYAQTELSEGERAKLTEVREAFGRYAEARLDFFRLMEAGKADEATQMRNARLTPAGGATNKAFAELIDVQRKQTSADAAADNQSLSRARAALLVIFGVALVASMLALSWVLRSVLRQLGGEPALVTDHVRRVAQGDLRHTVDTAGAAAGSLLGALAEMQKRLAGLVGQVRTASDSIATGSSEIAAGNANLSQRTEQQASNLQQTAASMEELTATVKQQRRHREAGQPTGGFGQRCGREGRRGGGPGGGHHGRHHRELQEDRRHHRRHRRHRVPDQHPGAERGGGSRARRRTGPRLRGGGQRGAQPGAAQRRGGQGDQDADRRQRREGRSRLGAGGATPVRPWTTSSRR